MSKFNTKTACKKASHQKLRIKEGKTYSIYLLIIISFELTFSILKQKTINLKRQYDYSGIIQPNLVNYDSCFKEYVSTLFQNCLELISSSKTIPV